MTCLRAEFIARPFSISASLIWGVFALHSTIVHAAEGEAFFESRVRPILVDQCVSCHGAKKQESSLRLDSRAAVLRGGDSGSAVVAGDVDASLLIEAIRGESLEMPPDDPLDAGEIEVLEEWVRMGAPWPATDAPPAPALGDQDAILKVARQHWAFQPVNKRDVPNFSEGQNPIDVFVQEKLTTAGLQPASPADRRTLIRRAYFDVIGLPPSLDEIHAFENDPSPAAFETVVDGLLESEHYGERWARHWLDIARYADTREWLAANADTRYPFAWTYRDYVIQSLNSDKPYDQFLKEQIAADFYTDESDDPSLAALGFLTVGSRFRNRTEELVADQIDVITRGTMALTVTCARCHDHKYDPIPTADYYSLFGVLASTTIPDDFPAIRGARQNPELLADYTKARAAKVAELETYGVKLQRDAQEHIRKQLPKYFSAYYDMAIQKSAQVLGVLLKYKVRETAVAPVARHLEEIRTKPQMKKDSVWGPWAVALNMKKSDFASQWPKAVEQFQSGHSTNPLILNAVSAKSVRSQRQLVNAYAAVFNRLLKAGPARGEHQEEIYRALLGDDGGILNFTAEECINASKVLGPNRVRLARFENAIREVDVTHPGSPPRAMRVEDRDKLVDPYVMLRGEPGRRGDRVPRQFLAILSGDNRQPFARGSGRMGLAEAVAGSRNPLTPRVIVNRVWMKYFGRGFVATPGDFGLRCEPPSHPELLDWLAATFMEDGWSLKKLHRRILLSKTYQQSSEGADIGLELDPENRMLSRARRKRLDFESMRDAMLSASQQLNHAVGGRSVKLFEEPFTNRRTVYGYIDRVEMEPLLKVFDFPSPYASAPQRAETTIPQQSLFAMNHPFVVEQARQLAALVRSAPSAVEQVSKLYERVYGRTATDRESQLVTTFVTAPAADVDAPATPNVWRYGYGHRMTKETGATEFTELTHWTGQHYQVSDRYPDSDFGHLRISANGGHPGRHGVAVIRRWVAPAQGTVRITGKVDHRRDQGDGIAVQIVVNGHDVVAEADVFNGKVGVPAKGIVLEAGDTIDLIADSGKTTPFDRFNWAPTITGQGGALVGQSWSAYDGFKAPAPPPMDSLEQFAQALLLTNEFLYVD